MRLYGALPPQTERNAPRPCLQNGAQTMISKPAQAIVERKACRDAGAVVQRNRTTPALHDSAGQDIATIHSSPEAKNGAETRTAIRHGGGRHGLSRPNRTMSHSRALLLTLLFQPARAVFISQWANCLSPSINATDPIQLQWVPLYVGTVFATSDTGHKLTVTVWGNVTGTYQATDATDANFTATEIMRDPFPTSAAKITTLHSEIDVLTYEPYSANYDFCNDALINATCPLGPVTDTTDMIIPYGLPSISMEKVFDTSYAFTSFSPTFEIIYGDAQKTQIGCISATVTPDLGGLAWMLKFLPLFVLIFVGFATIFASIYSPWGTTDIFHWSSNFGRHSDLLRLVTPGFGDCLQYIQFITLTGGLSLNYPGFYQPVVSQASWSVLMFNESFVTKDVGWQSLVDGVYHTNGTYGMESYAQLVGLGHTVDIWAGMMIWLLIVVGSVTIITQLAFAVQWLYRYVRNVQEEDLRNKNLPFTVGNVVRIVFNFFLLPLVALSMFQLVVFSRLYAYTGILAALTILLLLVFAGWLLYLITTTKPRSVLFDDLSTVLLWGPLYNTYSDEAATFALIPALLTFVRGIAIGAVQPSGIAQIVILAICEVVQVISLHAFKPFSSPTSMNAYHTLFAVLRFATIILMTTFIDQLGLSDQSKGWVGYVILLIHGGVLVLCFMLNALQTSIEVIARLMGAGGDENRGLSQGPLLRIFGARQLSRRTSRRGAQSRQSQLSSTAMLAAGEAGKGGYIAPSGRVRSESAGSVNILMNHRHQRSSSAFDTLSFDAPPSRFDNGSTFTPTTPGEASTYSFLPSPATGSNRNVLPASALVADAPGDTFYRPPRRRRPTLENQSAQERARASWATSGDLSEARRSQVGPAVESPENDTNDRGAPAPITYSTLDFPTRTDYATREVDFYYGVQRGSKLNSGAPQRRLGTGPADPTGPVATATGWFRNVFGGKRKEKSKGFEVVRSARMPPAMRAGGGDYDDTDPPEGTPVAMGVLRSGPIDSDSDDGHRRHEAVTTTSPDGPAVTERLLNQDRASLDDSGEEAEVPRFADTRAAPVLPDVDAGEAFKLPSRNVSRARSRGASSSRADAPELPRKSSKRKSDLIQGLVLDIPGHHSGLQPSPVIEQQAEQPSRSQLQPLATSRLPFESRSSSSNRAPSVSSLGETDSSDLQRVSSEHRPTSLGAVPVHHGNISRFPSDHRGKIQGREAEFVDD